MSSLLSPFSFLSYALYRFLFYIVIIFSLGFVLNHCHLSTHLLAYYSYLFIPSGLSLPPLPSPVAWFSPIVLSDTLLPFLHRSFLPLRPSLFLIYVPSASLPPISFGSTFCSLTIFLSLQSPASSFLPSSTFSPLAISARPLCRSSSSPLSSPKHASLLPCPSFYLIHYSFSSSPVPPIFSSFSSLNHRPGIATSFTFGFTYCRLPHFCPVSSSSSSFLSSFPISSLVISVRSPFHPTPSPLFSSTHVHTPPLLPDTSLPSPTTPAASHVCLDLHSCSLACSRLASRFACRLLSNIAAIGSPGGGLKVTNGRWNLLEKGSEFSYIITLRFCLFALESWNVFFFVCLLLLEFYLPYFCVFFVRCR